MINQAFTWLNTCISAVWNWIIAIDNQVDYLKIFLALFLVYSLARFFIMPLMKTAIGQSRSDSVRKIRKESKQ